MHVELEFQIVVGPLEKPQALLTTEPSLLPEIKYLKEGGVDVAAEGKARVVKADKVLAD